MTTTTTEPNDLTITFTRINHDSNGNPRFVCHFLNLDVYDSYSGTPLPYRYAAACKLANTIGGRKYHTKGYGGGIVFQSYSLDELVAAINRITKKNFIGYKVD
jgi:hypothetical protein